MPTFLSDPADSLYIALFVLVLAALVVWVRYRTRKTLIAAGIAAGLLAALLLIDRLFDSPREIVIRQAAAFEADFNTGDWNKLEKHIAENFDRKGKRKADIKTAFDVAKAYNAKISLWSFNRDDVVVDGNTITVGFDVKPQGPEAEAFHRYVRGRFAKGPNGQWQVVSYTTYKALNRDVEEEVYGGW